MTCTIPTPCLCYRQWAYHMEQWYIYRNMNGTNQISIYPFYPHQTVGSLLTRWIHGNFFQYKDRFFRFGDIHYTDKTVDGQQTILSLFDWKCLNKQSMFNCGFKQIHRRPSRKGSISAIPHIWYNVSNMFHSVHRMYIYGHIQHP